MAVNGGTLDIHGCDLNVGALNGMGTIDNLFGNGSLTVGNGNASDTFSGTMQNSFGQLSLTKTGSGAFGLSGNVTLTGTATITAGAVNQSTGNLQASTVIVDGGAYNLSGGSLAAPTVYLGKAGTGSLTQTAGTCSVPSSLYLAYNPGSNGAYSLSGSGVLSAATEYVGGQGTGNFAHLGGANSVSTELYVGYDAGSSGGYSLSGSGLLSAPIEYIGVDGNGIFAQSGGANSVSNILAIGGLGGSGTYSLTGNSVLSVATEFVGNYGPGSVTQLGGTHSVASLILAENAGSTGTYNLDSGLLNVAAISGGSGNAAFNFGGGTLGALAAWSSSLNMNMSFIGGPGTIDTTGGNITLTGVLSGFGGLTKVGTGTLVLSGSNVFSGGTTISAGTLQIGNGGSSSGAALVNTSAIADAASLVLNSAGAWSLNANISGTGSVSQIGSGIVIFSGYNLYSGGTTLAAGELSISASDNLGTATSQVIFEGGTLQITGTAVTNLGGHSVNWPTFTGGFDIANVANVFTVSNPISGTGSLWKLGVGTLLLTGSNSYSGGTTISAGTLQVGNGDSGASIASSGGVLDNGSLVFNHGDSLTMLDIVSGNGNLAQTGTGVLILLGSNTYSGGTTISAGTLQVGNGGSGASIASSSSVHDNGSLVFDHSDGLALPETISGTGNLIQTGTGVLTLLGSNTSSGGTTVNAGTLVFASSQAIGGSGPDVTVNYGATAVAGYLVDQNFLDRLAPSSSGVVALAVSSTNNLNLSSLAILRLGALGSATYSGTLTPSGSTYQLGGGGGQLTVTGPLSGRCGLDAGTNGTAAGTVVLAAAMTYTGPTQVSGGTLVVQGANASSSFTAGDGGVLQFSGASINLGSALCAGC